MQQTLKSKMITSATWLIGSNLTSQILRLASNLILTRILMPSDFGLIAAVSTLYLALVMFSDFGLWQCVVKSPHGTQPRFLGTAWTIQILRGVLLAIIVLICSGIIFIGNIDTWFENGSVYTDTRLPGIMALFAISALLQGLESMNLALAQREVKLNRLARLEMLSQFISIVLTVLLAWHYQSVWALAIGSMVGTVMRTALSHLYLTGQFVKPCWDKEYASEIFGFGKWIFLSSLVGFLAANGERILLAGTLSAATFGVFSIATTILAAITGIYSAINAHIVYAGLSHVARHESLSRTHQLHNRMQMVADALLGFLAGMLLMTGPLIISVLYDARYQEAGWMLQWLGIGLIALRYQVVEQLMFTQNKPQLVTMNNVLRVLLLVVCIPLGFHLGGTEGAIIAVVLSQFGSWPLSIFFKVRTGLMTWQSETLWIPAFMLGIGSGWLLKILSNLIFSS